MRYSVFSSGGNGVTAIDCIGYSDDISVTRFGPTKRNQYIIHYVLSGKGFFNGNPVRTGEGFLIRPGTFEHYFPDESDPWSFLWVISSDEGMESIFDGFRAHSKTNIFAYSNTDVVFGMRDKLTSLVPESPECFFAPTEMLEFFLHIYNNQNLSHTVPESAADTYCSYAESYIGSNLFRPLGVSELTSVLGITQPYLYRIFRNRYNMSPKRYIDTRKCAEARRLLSETALTVTDIAKSLGYGEVTAFSKFFKQNTGVSPKNYRENADSARKKEETPS